jgi:hypothetical protein
VVCGFWLSEKSSALRRAPELILLHRETVTLVIPRHRHQTAIALECAAKERLVGDSLGTGIKSP